MATISVIVPVYKVEKYLDRCIGSILNQTYTDYELILVDDGSPDRCGEICDAYAAAYPHIHVIHQANGGLSAARNSGIEWMNAHSDSRYVTFIDSDDWIHPQYLEILMHGIRSIGAEVSMVACWQITEYSGSFTPYDVSMEPAVYNGEELFLSRQWDFNYAWGKLYQRKHFETLRYPAGKNYEDVFTTYQILFTCDRIALIDEPLYFYFFNPEGICHSVWNPGELIIFEGMRQQMDYYQKYGFSRAFDKEEGLFINHFAYELTRIRENREQWHQHHGIWRSLRREMWAEMKARGGKYTYKTMPQCFEAAFPRIAALRHLAGRCLRACKRYGLKGMAAKIIEKAGGRIHGNS